MEGATTHSDGASPFLKWHNGGRVFDQVGIVVRDMDSALRFFTNSVGIGPWRVYSHGPGLSVATLNGKPAQWTVWLAFSPWDSRPQIELIQPVSGDSVHHRYLAERGEGVQHYGLIPLDYDRAYRELSARFACIQESAGYGTSHDGHNAYFDTRTELFGAMLEIFVPPTQRPEPLAEWPLRMVNQKSAAG